MQEIVIGNIVGWKDNGAVLIEAALPDIDKATRRQYHNVTIGFNDARHISADQRGKIYALMAEIAEYMGESPEGAKQALKMDFVLNHMQNMQRKVFSLANVSMEIATDFISYLIEFIIRNGIPTKRPIDELDDSISHYVYTSTKHKRCCVCGRAAELHHCEGGRIGMGADRKEVHHMGRPALALCREHHSEAHQSEEAFFRKYHLEPVGITDELCKIYKLKK